VWPSLEVAVSFPGVGLGLTAMVKVSLMDGMATLNAFENRTTI
jgi:hypothetical protein